MLVNNTAIDVANVSKCYRIGLADELPDSIGETFFNFVKSPLKNYRKYKSLYTFSNMDPGDAVIPQDILWALKNVSFDVKSGESVGIIGRNGSGKSTILKTICKITSPTKGRIVVNGRISSLLEVGTGFHQELTGRENIYLNGTILGMRKKEIDAKLDEIIDFSGIEKFIDTPVKRYSSGMRVRLAFSVAAHLEPEILLIDEVLAVGDADFQKKCLGKMGEVTRQGRTILFVSHQMGAVEKLCDRVIWLHDGTVMQVGRSTDIISEYLNSGSVADKIGPGGDLSVVPREKGFKVIMSKGTINDIPIQGEHLVQPRKPFVIELDLEIPEPMKQCSLGVHFRNISGECVYSSNTAWFLGKLNFEKKGKYRLRCEIPELPLAPNAYRLWLAMSSHKILVDRLESVVTVNVARADVFESGELPGPNQGYFLPKSDWSLDSL